MRKVNNWDEWIDYFRYWQDSIGLERKELREFSFDVKFDPLEVDAIEFGHYKGQRKWKTLLHIPDQRIRDTLLNLVVYQGDTEFASVEQQRNLLDSPPSSYDLLAITRVMCEEMRHGWQMCALLIEHFGQTGKVEAQKMLERRAFENKRLLNAFNENVDNWLDFFAYTDFVDRDGKFQLQMLKYSAFAPLGRSMSYMLREEAFHMGTGNYGLRRVVEAGVVPRWLIQKYLNKWISSSYDLFGTDHSSSAHWAYVWGLKGRFDERDNPTDADKAALNDYNRLLYRDACVRLVDRLNQYIPERERWLKVPEITFNRRIGTHAGECRTVDGEPVSRDRYADYVASVTPQPADYALLGDIIKAGEWIEAREAN